MKHVSCVSFTLESTLQELKICFSARYNPGMQQGKQINLSFIGQLVGDNFFLLHQKGPLCAANTDFTVDTR